MLENLQRPLLVGITAAKERLVLVRLRLERVIGPRPIVYRGARWSVPFARRRVEMAVGVGVLEEAPERLVHERLL